MRACLLRYGHGHRSRLYSRLLLYRRLLSRLYSGEFDALEILKLKRLRGWQMRRVVRMSERGGPPDRVGRRERLRR